MEISPIGYIHTDFKDKFGIPRQSGRVPALTGRIVPEPAFRNEEAFRDIEQFSHLWLIFGFSAANRERPAMTVRPPRLGGNQRVGVFATRSPFRPNALGLSVVRLERVERHPTDGLSLVVSGVDLLDGTPIYDIKPYLPHVDSVPDARGGFAGEFRDYGLEVVFPEELLQKLPEEKREAAVCCLKEDPRPSYQADGRDYAMNFAGFDIRFRVSDGVLTVSDVIGRL